MARAILVMGEPGTGKSRAIKGLDPRVTVIIKPNAKELPFRGAGKMYKLGMNMFHIQTLAGVSEVMEKINKDLPFVKNIVLEDLTHYWSKRQVDEIAVTGFGKWNNLAADTKKYVVDKESTLRPDLNLIIIAHVESNQDALGTTQIGLQTPGKLTDKIVKIPSFFTYIFHTIVDVDPATGSVRYRFLTNKDGVREAKTPEEMFPLYIENDYKVVIEGITKYQLEEGIKPVGMTLDEKAEADKKKAEAVAKAAESTTTASNTPVEKTKEPEQVQEQAPSTEQTTN